MEKYQDIFKKLCELQNNSVCTYSHYRVASVIKTDTGQYYGVNVEPSVMNLGICAERNALFSALTFNSKYIKTIYLLTDSKTNFGSPCGACRQLLLDYADKNTEVIMFNLSGEHKKIKLFDLVPLMWTKEELE